MTTKALRKSLDSHPLKQWLARRDWDFYDHQIETLQATLEGKDVLLLAPTGAGKTLSSFLPAIHDLTKPKGRLEEEAEKKDKRGFKQRLHTLYISPLKALTVDIQRNLLSPIEELELPILVETRTGDTSSHRRAKQKLKPPHCLMTTPESLALMMSYEDWQAYFGDLRYIIVDEVHSIMNGKRGDMLMLNLERLHKAAPEACRIGLSATVKSPSLAEAYFCRSDRAKTISVDEIVKPEITILMGARRMPWRGHSGCYAMPEVYEEICKAEMSIVFVNTRSQAEKLFQTLEHINDGALQIEMHHGSLEKELRLEVEEKMAAGDIDCVVATSSLDLGLDFGQVDLVIQIGAPKGVSRLLQRVGRSNHRIDEPSRAVLVPANRFEYLECLAAKDSVAADELDGVDPKQGSLDVLAQHITGAACSGGFNVDDLYTEINQAWPYKDLPKEQFIKVVEFVKNGGYALRQYDRYARIVETDEGNYEIANKKFIQQYRMNIGTIVQAAMLKVKLKMRTLGLVEEWFVQNLTQGDTFIFGGRVLRYKNLSQEGVQVEVTKDLNPKVPTYAGGRMPLSTHLSERVRGILNSPDSWDTLPSQVGDWLQEQVKRSSLPSPEGCLTETFARGKGRSLKHYFVIYTFEGRNANQTLGFLISKRMEQLDLKPMGFVATDYALSIWGLREIDHVEEILTPDLMDIEMPDWLSETSLIKRNFKEVAIIGGLIERRLPGKQKSGKQVMFSTDLIYDVLKQYEPDHILMQAAKQDALTGLIDLDRVQQFLERIQSKIQHNALDQVSPLGVPLVLEVSRESVNKEAADDYLLEELEEKLLAEIDLHV